MDAVAIKKSEKNEFNEKFHINVACSRLLIFIKSLYCLFPFLFSCKTCCKNQNEKNGNPATKFIATTAKISKIRVV